MSPFRYVLGGQVSSLHWRRHCRVQAFGRDLSAQVAKHPVQVKKTCLPGQTTKIHKNEYHKKYSSIKPYIRFIMHQEHVIYLAYKHYKQ